MRSGASTLIASLPSRSKLWSAPTFKIGRLVMAPLKSANDDPSLVARCQQSDREAQRQFYELHHRQIFRLTVRMVGRQDADDVTQQVFLTALRKIGTFSGRSRLSTWLYRVAVNECLQHLRRRRRHHAASLEDDTIDTAAPSSSRSEDTELLEGALARLDADLRTTFLLREVEQLSYREIAAATQISEGTVASRLNRARRLLCQHLRALGWSPIDEDKVDGLNAHQHMPSRIG